MILVIAEKPSVAQSIAKVLRDLMRDKRVAELVCATDAGREGELIFRLVYNKALLNALSLGEGKNRK